MASNWRILDLTYFEGTIKFNSRSRKMEVISKTTGEVFSHSLPDVNIIFIGLKVQLGSGILYHLASNDVVSIFCDWRGLPVSSLYPWIDSHGRVAARQRAQAALSIPRSKNAWMRIVKAKIKGQAHVLKSLDILGYKDLLEIAAKTRSGDPDNREGQAARIYWKKVFNDTAFLRKPGIREAGKNGLLDYGYTILRGHSMRAVLAAGLTPALGLYHKGRSNAFALADDLIEPFRPAVDYIVATLEPASELVSKETRRAILEVCNGSFGKSKKTIPTLMIELAQHYGQYVEGEVPVLEVPIYQI